MMPLGGNMSMPGVGNMSMEIPIFPSHPVQVIVCDKVTMHWS